MSCSAVCRFISPPPPPPNENECKISHSDLRSLEKFVSTLYQRSNKLSRDPTNETRKKLFLTKGAPLDPPRPPTPPTENVLYFKALLAMYHSMIWSRFKRCFKFHPI